MKCCIMWTGFYPTAMYDISVLTNAFEASVTFFLFYHIVSGNVANELFLVGKGTTTSSLVC